MGCCTIVSKVASLLAGGVATPSVSEVAARSTSEVVVPLAGEGAAPTVRRIAALSMSRVAVPMACGVAAPSVSGIAEWSMSEVVEPLTSGVVAPSVCEIVALLTSDVVAPSASEGVTPTDHKVCCVINERSRHSFDEWGRSSVREQYSLHGRRVSDSAMGLLHDHEQSRLSVGGRGRSVREHGYCTVDE